MKPLTFFFSILAAAFAVGFAVFFIRFEHYNYNCVDGIRAMLFVVPTFGFAIIAAVVKWWEK